MSNRKGKVESSKKGAGTGTTPVPKSQSRQPACVALAGRGVKNCNDVIAITAAGACDCLLGRLEPRAANAACNFFGKMLKAADMQQKYGTPVVGSDGKELRLLPG